MNVFGCQLDTAWEDPPRNLTRAGELLAPALIPHGSLIVLPEMFSTGFSMDVERVAEDSTGPAHRFLAKLAAERRSHVMGGVVTRAVDGRGLNEAVVYGPDGHEVCRYVKLHPFSFGGETRHYAAGSHVTMFSAERFKIAPFICYDLRFPEVFRRAVHFDVELLVVIANWPQTRQDHWQALLKARAIENQAYVLGVNRTGSDPQLTYAGGSVMFDPRGNILAGLDERPGLLHAEIELKPLVDYRQSFPALGDIRGEFLGQLP